MNPPQRRLLPPVRREQLSFIIDLSEHLTHFFEVVWNFRDQDGIEGAMTQTSDMDLIVLAQETIADMLVKGGEFNGISHADIGDLKRQGEVRAILYPEMSNRFTYKPIPSPTESYHMAIFEDQMGLAIRKFYGRYQARNAEVDVLMWRVLGGLVLDIAQAVGTVGTQENLSEMAMMNYEFGATRPLGARVEYVYLMKLHTRPTHGSSSSFTR